jgi:hypothetical protein
MTHTAMLQMRDITSVILHCLHFMAGLMQLWTQQTLQRWQQHRKHRRKHVLLMQATIQGAFSAVSRRRKIQTITMSANVDVTILLYIAFNVPWFQASIHALQ